VRLELSPTLDRPFTSGEFARRWREQSGSVPGATELVFSSSGLPIGADLQVQLSSADPAALGQAAESLEARLRDFPGVHDVASSWRGSRLEAELHIRPEAEAAGLSLADLGRQVRQGIHGAEAQHIQRGRDDVAVMVRYPSDERRSLGDLEAMWIRTPQGDEVPFAAVAEARYGLAPAEILRANRRRIVDVTANVDPAVANANEVLAAIRAQALPALLARHPGLTSSFEGQQREQSETLFAIARGTSLALFVIYALLAVTLGSYAQPLLVISAVPFGMVGATLGHLLLGMDLSAFALIGVTALAGVVVNDSLVLLCAVNREREQGQSAHEAVRRAATLRFRPILLTSLTTFVGLAPILLESSPQAQWLKPAAVSLAFGILFATLVTPFVIPCGYLILEDLRGRTRAAS
jgi:multidrug efflux pump subunit AcrB